MPTHTRVSLALAASTLLFLVPCFASAAVDCSTTVCLYVRPEATGSNSGLDWANAYAALPNSLQRGATYFLADGNYAPHTFNDPVSGTQMITVKKATQAEHGTSTGWDLTYGDGQAVFSSISPIEFDTSYYVLDGATGSGMSGYGMVMHFAYPYLNAAWTNGAFMLMNSSTPVTHITISHFEMDGGGARPAGLADTDQGPSFFYAASNLISASDITFTSDYVHDLAGRPFTVSNVTNFTVQNSVIARNRSTSAVHAEGIACGYGGNYVIANNIWEDIEGTGVIVCGPVGGTVNGMQVYGNIFRESNGPTGTLAHGVVSDNAGSGPITNLRFFNNTIYNIHKGLRSGILMSNSTGALVENNLWFNNSNQVSFPEGSNGSHSYNSILNTPYQWDVILGANDIQTNSGSPDPFVNSAGGDLHLTSATASGTTLSSPYTQDPDGITRGADGIWDRGAFEFNGTGGTPAPTVSLTASPTSITAGQSSTLTWSSTNATSCTGTNFSASATSGSATVTPSTTTTYSLACTGAGGSATQSTTVTVAPVTPPANKFVIGDRVLTTDKVNVRQSPSTSKKPVGLQKVGALGTVTQGPQTGSGYTWWYIDFDSGADGWVAEDYLAKATAALNTATTNTTTANNADTATVIARLQRQVDDLIAQVAALRAALVAATAAAGR